jgi:preprotein translocase subunit SecG
VLIFLLTLHFLITLILIGLVLLQKDEESGSSSMYGGGMPQRRGRGHPLARATYIVGGLFFANCLLMAWLSSGETRIMVAPPATTMTTTSATQLPSSPSAPVNATAPGTDQNTPAPAETKKGDQSAPYKASSGKAS